MRTRWIYFLTACASFAPWPACAQAAKAQDSLSNNGSGVTNPPAVTKVPSGVILVKGAWSSASDSTTPLPEDGNVTGNVFRDPYFGISWTLPPDWFERYKGPPPSDSGRYVLAEIVPSDSYKGPVRGSILITADDLFFTPLPVTNATELVNYTKENLLSVYQVERPPAQIAIAGRPFTLFAYWSPSAELHWVLLATEIRCHTVEIVLSSSSSTLLDELMQNLKTMKLPAEEAPAAGDAVPVCIKDYARDENVIARVDPVFSERRFNSIPVRIVIGKDGKVKHIHFLRAFPDQAKAITDALRQWKFKPYLRNGEPVDVETGIVFGNAARASISAEKSTAPK